MAGGYRLGVCPHQRCELTARERAEQQHWNVTPCPRGDRNPAGNNIAKEIREWNAEAQRNRDGVRRLREELR